MPVLSETVPSTFSFWSPADGQVLVAVHLLELVRLDDQVTLVADPLEVCRS